MRFPAGKRSRRPSAGRSEAERVPGEARQGKADGALRAEESVAPKKQRDYRTRALALWPRLDREKLRRTRGEAARIARLVERRTALPFEMILGMLRRRD